MHAKSKSKYQIPAFDYVQRTRSETIECSRYVHRCNELTNQHDHTQLASPSQFDIFPMKIPVVVSEGKS